MALQFISPNALFCLAPALSLSEKEFKSVCTKNLARPVRSYDQYGVYSYRLELKIYPTGLCFPPGGDHTYPGRVHQLIVKHAKLMKLDKAVYLVPATSVNAMVDSPHTLAKQLADSLGRTIYVYRGPNGGLRIGEIRDDGDLHSIENYTYIAEGQPHAALIHTGLHFGDEEADDTVSDTATPSTVDAYVHLKQTSRASQVQVRSRSRTKKNEIPKPQNSWILYLNDNYARVKTENDHMNTCEISKVIAANWKEVRDGEVGDHYKALANKAKEEHRALYGDYKVKPRKSNEIKRRNAKKIKTVVSLQADLSPAEDSVGIDTSEFQEDNKTPKYTWQPINDGRYLGAEHHPQSNGSLGFAPEGSGIFAGQDGLATANQDGHWHTSFESPAFGMQGSSDFTGDAAFGMKMQGNFDVSGLAVDFNNNYVTAASDEEFLGFADDLAGLPDVDDFVLDNFDLPGHDQFNEIMELMNRQGHN